MPMFGSTLGGKSGVASTLEKDDTTASKGVRPKEDADQGSVSTVPHNDESMSREISPQKACQTYIPENALITIQSRRHPHLRRWSWISHPAHLHIN